MYFKHRERGACGSVLKCMQSLGLGWVRTGIRNSSQVSHGGKEPSVCAIVAASLTVHIGTKLDLEAEPGLELESRVWVCQVET